MIDHDSYQTIIFSHIPKTAGMTMCGTLEALYPPHLRHSVDASQTDHDEHVRRFKSTPPEQHAHLRLIVGHHTYGFHKYLPSNATYFTIVRDPIDRLVSSYYQLVSVIPHLPERVAFYENPPTLEEFVEQGDLYYKCDSLVKLFIEHPNRAEPVTEALFREALRALHEDYSLVGLMGQFDETVVLANQLYGWTINHYLKRNISSNYSRDKVPEGLRETYAERNRWDMQFFEETRNLFNERRASYRGDFDSALQLFRSSNAKKNRAVQRKQIVKRTLKRILGKFR